MGNGHEKGRSQKKGKTGEGSYNVSQVKDREPEFRQPKRRKGGRTAELGESGWKGKGKKMSVPHMLSEGGPGGQRGRQRQDPALNWATWTQRHKTWVRLAMRSSQLETE